MSRFTIVFLLMMSLFSLASAQTAKPTLQCVKIQELNSSLTPVDLAVGVIDCIHKDKYKEGLEMYILFGAYGWFDSMRVVDVSAHQAIPVLKTYISGVITEDKKDKWYGALDTAMEEKNLNKLCSEIKRIGMPEYYPDYMIMHGLQAFSDGGASGVHSDFNAQAGWEEALDGYLHCK